MAIQRRIENPSLSDYLEVMTRAVFQAGLRWSLIEAKWPNFLRLFHKFDTAYIAHLGEKEIDEISNDPGILRSRRKVEATVANAREMLMLNERYHGFKNYLRSFQTYESLSHDLHRRFKYMGELNVYYFLFRVGETVPPFDDWVKTIPGDHPRMREMVLS